LSRDYGDYLQDILDAIDDVATFTADMSFETFEQDRKTLNAVLRSLEVLGKLRSIFQKNFELKLQRFLGNAWQAYS